jgi:3-deoxy-D-manno-octulosonic-acid transferase
VKGVQWLIVPRHPQRFDEVADLVRAQGFTLSRRSQWGEQTQAADIWLGDSLGEMALYYGLSDAALLGGSFEPLGGQNLIEAAACGCPVLMGPHTFNFEEAASLAEAAGAAVRYDSMVQAVQAVQALVGDPARQRLMTQAASRFAQAHRGAAGRTSDAVLALLGQQGIDAL